MSDGFDFDQWLTEARVAQTSVEVLQRPDLVAELQDWQRRFDREEKASRGERSLSDADPLADLRAEGELLMEQVKASRATFYLAGVSDDDERAIEAAYPIPDAPIQFDLPLPELANRATVEQSNAFLAAWEAWKQARDQWIGEHADELAPWQEKMEKALRMRGAERIARAVVSIKQNGITNKVRMTAAQVLRMELTLGKPQMTLFSSALDSLKDSTPEVPEVTPAFLSRT